MARRLPFIALAIATAVVLSGIGLAVAERALATHLDDEGAERLRVLLPGGEIDWADVTDDPALVVALAGQWDHTMAEGTDASGGAVRISAYGYQRDSGRAEIVDWTLLDRPYASGLLREIGFATNVGEGEIAGHAVRVQLAGYVEDGDVIIVALGITLDGTPTALEDLPDAVRVELEPVRVPLPYPRPPGASDITVHVVRFTESTILINVTADNVTLGGAE